MRRVLFLVAMLAAADNVRAQIVAAADDGIVVAHDGVVEKFDATGKRRLWSAQGVPHASSLVVAGAAVAVLDGYANRIAVVRNGTSQSFETGETPVDVAFAGEDVFVVARDASRLDRFAPDGKRTSVDVGADPAFVRTAGGRLYVYSRLDGLIQEIDPQRLAVTRRVAIAPFASDFEIDAKNGYLLYPREAKIQAFSLATLQAVSSIDAGGTPVDMAVVRGNALSASRLVVADPAAKRVWTIEGLQSVGGAFGRGFLRGLLGLGLFSPAHTEFPTGIDRITARGASVVAYDTSSGTLYRVRGSKSVAVAVGVGPGDFAVAGDGVAVWQNGAIRLIR